jgi:Zn-dependent peptidase ImmA (M78 family)
MDTYNIDGIPVVVDDTPFNVGTEKKVEISVGGIIYGKNNIYKEKELYIQVCINILPKYLIYYILAHEIGHIKCEHHKQGKLLKEKTDDEIWENEIEADAYAVWRLGLTYKTLKKYDLNTNFIMKGYQYFTTNSIIRILFEYFPRLASYIAELFVIYLKIITKYYHKLVWEKRMEVYGDKNPERLEVNWDLLYAGKI